MTGIARCRREWTPYIFDYQRNVRRRELDLGDAGTLPIVEVGASSSRRFYRTDTLGFMRMARRFGGSWHSGLRALTSSLAVLDASGGDSFTDLYGPRRFADVTTRKQLALDQGAKLILLPQTYGPFQSERARQTARDLIRRSSAAWARDPESHEFLRDLLGNDYNSTFHRQGVDVAFGLDSLTPRSTVAEFVEAFVDTDAPLTVGVNVSGLLYNSGREAAEQYGLRADYRRVIHEFVRRLIVDADANVLLVPHVVRQIPKQRERSPSESDSLACQSVADDLAEQANGHLAVLPELHDPREAKWVISKMDWFCGTRMHSTIAALSTLVPTAALSYSLKTRGVFKTCDVSKTVIDPRSLDTCDTIDALWDCFEQRETARTRLVKSIPEVARRTAEQMALIVADMCRTASEESDAST